MHRRKLAELNPLPLQTFFIPLPEEVIYNDMFFHINPDIVEPPVESMVSFSISTDNTVVWYDHWEDNFDGTYGADSFRDPLLT